MIHDQDAEGKTALHHAALLLPEKKVFQVVVAFLLGTGIDANVLDASRKIARDYLIEKSAALNIFDACTAILALGNDFTLSLKC